MRLTVVNLRRDRKFKVRYYWDGEPNMFGGHYPGTAITKILTAEQLDAEILRCIEKGHLIVNESIARLKVTA